MNRSQQIAILLDLLRIPGASGDEDHVAAFIQQAIERLGYPGISPICDGAGNVVLALEGDDQRGRRLFTAHMDTIDLCVGAEPLMEGDRIINRNPNSGLGADNRTGCAVLLAVLGELCASGRPHAPLTFAWTVKEEVGQRGAQLLDLELAGQPSHGFNFDGGTSTKITHGAYGKSEIRIEVLGVAAHAGNNPASGANAVVVASRIASAVHRLSQSIARGAEPILINVARIEGGGALNVIPAHAVISIEVRSFDIAARQMLFQKIEDLTLRLIRRASQEALPRISAHVSVRDLYPPFQLKRDDMCCGLMARAVTECGATPTYSIGRGGTDANQLNVRGIPSVSLGCGQRETHSLKEYVDLSSFYQACDIALRLAAQPILAL